MRRATDVIKDHCISLKHVSGVGLIPRAGRVSKDRPKLSVLLFLWSCMGRGAYFIRQMEKTFVDRSTLVS